MDAGVKPRSIPYEKIDIDYSVIFLAIKTAFEGKKNESESIAHYSMDHDNTNSKDLNIDEELIIDALKAVSLQPDHIE